ncbi:MAG: methyltransferase [Alphaproteobacteria bacterium]|nr:methyltransferase [Alphaproteobacteria bacterium]
MTNYKTEQENFWATEFGNEYIDRNKSHELLAANLAFFSSMLQCASKINSVMEFGANIGMNIHTLKKLLPNAKLSAVEINKKACDVLAKIENVEAHNASILEFETEEKFDLVFTKGVLIHINPDELDKVYEKMYNASKKYILVGEYYNPSPVAIPYRGHSDRLFKRDFAGDLMDKYNDLKLVDYKFFYKRDNNFPQDDVTWFLLEKEEGDAETSSV